MTAIASFFFGERSLSKVAALYDSRERAATAAQAIHNRPGLEQVRLDVIGPQDIANSSPQTEGLGVKLEPETKGIWRTFLRAHTTCGVLGILLGCAVWAVLLLMNVPWAVSSPWFTLMSTSTYGMLAGLLVGGLITMRPDHNVVIAKVRHATRHGRWAVVGHPLDTKQHARLRDAFADTSSEVVDTL
ncbi:MAG: hypothetical protein ACOZD0_11830 [Pseudomonadota bacterium]